MTHWVLRSNSIRRRVYCVAAIALLSGCYDRSAKEISGIDAKGQPWVITLAAQPETLRLPETQTMRLLGGDLSAYIKEKCEPLWLSERCDVYAQADPTGALLGYLNLVKTGDNSLSFATDTMTDKNQECVLGGKLENIQGDVNGDFSARSPFQYVGEGRDAGGMIYIKKRGRSLQLTDERWNYCYNDRHIDDIYVFVGSLVRSAPKAAAGKASIAPSSQTLKENEVRSKNTIPNHFWGRWTDKISYCTTRYDDSSVEIYADAVRFWESEGEVDTVRESNDETLVTLSMHGEGESWQSDIKLEKMHGSQNILINGEPKTKCP